MLLPPGWHKVTGDNQKEHRADNILMILLHDLVKHANRMTMTTSGQIMLWSDCLKTKGNVNINFVWDFDCLHFVQYILISAHCIDCKQA